MKAATAPTPPSPWRRAATSAPRSKSSLRIETRADDMRTPSASSQRREEADFVAVAERRAVRAQNAVACAAQDALAAQRLAVAVAARDQRVAQRGDVGAGVDLDLLARTERLAHRGEVAHRDLHPSNSGSDR